MGNILIADAQSYSQKLIALEKSDGVSVVADFDHTITQSRRVSASCFGLLATIPGIDPRFAQDRNALFAEYHPHELAPHYTKSERDRWMEEWWDKALKLHHKYILKDSHFQSVDAKRASIRGGWREFLDFCTQHRVPTHILSAGITQIIRRVLEHNDISTESISITSNSLLFDTNGNYLGSSPDKPIHTGNKAIHTIPQDDMIVLLGDSIDDAHMAGEGRQDHVLKIAFHNPEVEISPEKYLEQFDVVIESGNSDGGFLQDIARRIQKQ